MHEPFTTAEAPGLTDRTSDILDTPSLDRLPTPTDRIVRDALTHRLLAGRMLRPADIDFIAGSIADGLDDDAFEAAARRAARRAVREW